MLQRLFAILDDAFFTTMILFATTLFLFVSWPGISYIDYNLAGIFILGFHPEISLLLAPFLSLRLENELESDDLLLSYFKFGFILPINDKKSL